MSVFISWSGESSRLVAVAWQTFLKNVIQTADPWMSANDIEKGSFWRSNLRGRLEESRIGIICLTPDNLDSSWLLFEAGALSKTKSDEQAHVCMYLVGLEQRDVIDPLAQFQMTVNTEEDTLKSMLTINKKLAESFDNQPTNDVVMNVFEKFWPEFQSEINDAKNTVTVAAEERPPDSYFEEILQLVRRLPKDIGSIVQRNQSSKPVTDDAHARLRSLGNFTLTLTGRKQFMLAHLISGDEPSEISERVGLSDEHYNLIVERVVSKIGASSLSQALEWVRSNPAILGSFRPDQ